MAVIIPR